MKKGILSKRVYEPPAILHLIETAPGSGNCNEGSTVFVDGSGYWICGNGGSTAMTGGCYDGNNTLNHECYLGGNTAGHCKNGPSVPH